MYVQDDAPLSVWSVPHPKPMADRFGFPLDHPYVDRFLLPVLGPSSVAVLRQMPSLWERRHPFETDFGDLGRAFGLRPHRLSETFDRLEKFGFAQRYGESRLHIHSKCAPLAERLQERLPSWLRDSHAQVVEEHLAQVVGQTAERPPERWGPQAPTPVDQSHNGPTPPPADLDLQRPARGLSR